MSKVSLPAERTAAATSPVPLSRRALIGTAVALAAARALPATSPAGDVRTAISVLAGTYRAENGGGLYPLTFAPRDARWTRRAPVGEIADASFAVRSRRRDLIYVLQESARGRLGIWRSDPDWRLVGSVATGGADPCHLALDAGERHLAIANYGSGSVAFYTLDPATGLPVGPPVVSPNTGRGPNPERQSSPHAHWVGFAPGGRRLHSVDLGTDEVLSHALDVRGGSIGDASIAHRAPPGSGPRHLAYHPRLPTAYLVSELANTVTALRRLPDGGLADFQTVATLPVGFAGHSQAAHIAVNRRGSRLYVSNRGHDSLAVFALDADGRLALIQHVGTTGSWPRFFLLLEEHGMLLVANERSGTVVPFDVSADGRLAIIDASVTVPGVAFMMRGGA